MANIKCANLQDKLLPLQFNIYKLHISALIPIHYVKIVIN